MSTHTPPARGRPGQPLRLLLRELLEELRNLVQQGESQKAEQGNLLTTQDVAQILNVSRDYVRFLRRRRVLRCVRVGRYYRFSPKVIERFIKVNVERESESDPLRKRVKKSDGGTR